MERQVTIKPQQSLNVSLENVAHLKNPRLLISLDSDDLHHHHHNHANVLRNSVSSNSIHSLDFDDARKNSSKPCTSCESLKRMLYLRDRTIMKLAEDRDLVKIKLTKAMNMNIELSRQLMKYQKVSGQPLSQQQQPQTSNLPPTSPQRTKSPVNTQIKEEVADLRRKCTELDEIYHHLKHHLCALRNVFADLGANIPTDSGSGYHMDDEDNNDDSMSINSSVSATVGPLMNKKTIDVQNTKNYLADEDIEEDDDDGDADTDFRPLPPTRPSLLRKTININNKPKPCNVDNNNNGNANHNGVTKTVDDKKDNKKGPPPKQQLESEQEQEAQLSNFDIWYNS